MGGGYYDRDVGDDDGYQPATGYNVNVNNDSGVPITNTVERLHPSLDPKQWCVDRFLETDKKNPIIFALDVTGSMGDWTRVS